MDDFTGIVHNVFLELYTELNLESIELFQMNDEPSRILERKDL